MNIRKIAAGAGVAALALGAALPAAALTVKTGADANLTGSVGVTGSGVSNAAGTGSANANTGIDVNADVNGSADGSGTSNGGSGSSLTGNVSGNVSGGTVNISRSDIDAGGIDVESWGSRSASDVKSNADLKGYVASQIKNDDNLSAVASNATDVAVTYNQRGRFLGFIPVTVKATAMVDENGKVSVKYPWYAFLTATDRADLQAKLQASVDAVISGSASVNGPTGNTSASATGTANANANAAMKFNADTQARIIAEMRRIMGDELNASANANANANASAGSNQ